MTDDHSPGAAPKIALLIGIGLCVGAALGVLIARRAVQRGQSEMTETVEELRDRTQQVLNELTENVAVILQQTRLQTEDAVDTH